MYKAKTLKYEYSDLEPYIDTRTIGIHYNNHYLGYLNRLNKILSENNYDFKYSLSELLEHIDEFPIALRDTIIYNAGGVLNHELYFANISPRKNTTPTGVLAEAIIQRYGSFDAFKKEFIRNAKLVVGSGYTFLVVGKNGLEIINTSNQETPYLYGFTPIMAIDLWEHAYYLEYQSNRDAYIDNFFEIIDFDIVKKNYENTL